MFFYSQRPWVDEREFMATSGKEGEEDVSREASVAGTGLPKALCEGQAVSRLFPGRFQARRRTQSAAQAFWAQLPSSVTSSGEAAI